MNSFQESEVLMSICPHRVMEIKHTIACGIAGNIKHSFIVICHIDPIPRYKPTLSHPGLGWLYVFRSFLPPLRLLPLTSKLFELKFRYLGQRIYESGEMYWMPFLWSWPKVTAVASLSKNLLVRWLGENHSISQEWLVWLMWNETCTPMSAVPQNTVKPLI